MSMYPQIIPVIDLPQMMKDIVLAGELKAILEDYIDKTRFMYIGDSINDKGQYVLFQDSHNNGKRFFGAGSSRFASVSYAACVEFALKSPVLASVGGDE